MARRPFNVIHFNKDKILEDKFAFAIYDAFPVSKGHSLIIPKRIVFSVFDLSGSRSPLIFRKLRSDTTRDST